MTPALAVVFAGLYPSIPREILDITFNPKREMTTIDQRIIDVIINGRVLIDTNLVSGLRRQIEVHDGWRLKTIPPEFSMMAGSQVDYAYYAVPPEAREFRDISSVYKLYTNYPFAFAQNSTGVGGLPNSFGNSVMTTLEAAVSSRTMMDLPMIPPSVVLKAGNILQVYPQTWASGLIVDCLLNYDEEFTNLSTQTIWALRDLVICATKAYIYNYLRIKIDKNEVISGKEIGSFKDVIMEWHDENEKYADLLDTFIGMDMWDPDKFTEVCQLFLPG